MENMTKALLIAAAILIIVMLLSAVMIFWDEMAIYFSANNDAKILQQLVEFNNKFANYDQKTIRGNELVSVMNKIVDYNNYQSGIEGFEPIGITIDFIGSYYQELRYGGETGGDVLISSQWVDNDSGSDDTEIKRISETSARLMLMGAEIPGITDTKLQKLSSEISNIVDEPKRADFDTRDQYESASEAYKITRAQKLTRILGYTINPDDNVEHIKKSTYQYYQYTQFKRAMFECISITYDETNGRVNRMDFEVVLEDNPTGGKQIKFE